MADMKQALIIMNTASLTFDGPYLDKNDINSKMTCAMTSSQSGMNKCTTGKPGKPINNRSKHSQ